MTAMDNAESALTTGIAEALAFIEDCSQRRRKLSDELAKHTDMEEAARHDLHRMEAAHAALNGKEQPTTANVPYEREVMRAAGSR